jgi:hypothetical protein
MRIRELITESKAIVVGKKSVGSLKGIRLDTTGGRLMSLEKFVNETIPSWDPKLRKSPIDISIIVDLVNDDSSSLQKKYASLSGPNKLCAVVPIPVLDIYQDPNAYGGSVRLNMETSSLWMCLHDIGECIFQLNALGNSKGIELIRTLNQITDDFVNKHYTYISDYKNPNIIRVNNRVNNRVDHIHKYFLFDLLTMKSARTGKLARHDFKEIVIELFVQMIIKGHIDFNKTLPGKYFASGQAYPGVGDGIPMALDPNYTAGDMVAFEQQVQQLIIDFINRYYTVPIVIVTI